MPENIVETQYGKVQGTAQGAVFVWKGIPFARPPVGALRFRPPQPPETWSGVRDATHFGPIAPQPEMASGGIFGTSTKIPKNEDCLYLNVWSPGADDRRRAVLFWIHGGAFVSGSGSTPWYHGNAFVEHGDVVVVTINYRLGALGFSYLKELGGDVYGTSANCGLLDQIAALQWVRDNIAAFGGDPNNVTIFGESAGAMSIGVLLAMPAAKGLFRRAILQSGAAHNIGSRSGATRIANQFLEALGINSSDSASLWDVPIDHLLAAQTKVRDSSQGLAFRPIIDGDTLPHRPIEAIAGGFADGVPLLIGTNRDEMRLFTTLNPAQGILDEEELKRLFGPNAQHAFATYEAGQQEVGSAWIDILTDRVFRIPAIRLAERQAARGNPVWMYRFDWPTPAFGGRLKACHALEIPFVWDTLDKPGVESFTGNGPERQQVANYMHAAWIAFARNGDLRTSNLPNWPAYTTDQRATMIFNQTCHVEDDPQGAERRLWEGVL